MTTFTRRIILHIPTVVLVCILLLGAYLRMYKISEYMTFLGDEGRDMLVIKHMIVDHKFTLLGPTASVGGFFLGPIYYYFMLPFVWVSGLNPAGAAFMVALFGIATIYMVYRLGKEAFDEWVGLVAATLFSVSPIVIAYSRSSWNPNLVPFFSTLLIYFLWRSVVKNEPKILFWVGICLGIGLQLHYLFLFLFPVVGIWYLIMGRRRDWIKYYALGLGGFVIGYGPFLAFELRHGFPNTISIYNFLLEGKGTGFDGSTFWNTIFDVLYRVFGRLVFRLPPPEQWVNVPTFAQNIWTFGTNISIVASFFVILGLIIRRIPTPWSVSKKNTHPSWYYAAILFALWCVIPLTLFGFYKKGIYDYYFGLFFALPFLCVSLVLRLLRFNAISSAVVHIVLFGLIFFNWEGRPFTSLPNNQLGQARMIASVAYEKTEGKPYNFALMATSNSDHVYRYFFEIWGDPPLPIQNEIIDPQRKSVADQLIVICELQECKPLGNSLWEIAGFGRAQIADEWQVSFVKVMKLVHYKEEVQ